jgi:hypothetical protein
MILAALEADIRGIVAHEQPGQIVCEILLPK